MTDKEKSEMNNLRNRVAEQRKEIKRLQEEFDRLTDELERVRKNRKDGG